MNEKKISEEDFMGVLKSGHQWHSKKIKDEIEQLLIINSFVFNHHLSFNIQEKHDYVYDNECYLIIFDGKIELRSDRENVFSEGKTITYKINDAEDISSAYEHFKSLTMEDEQE
jgi:hypothetical protein